MKAQRLLIVLSLVNLALLIFTLAQTHPAAAQGVTPVLRGVHSKLSMTTVGFEPVSRCFLQAHRRMVSFPLKLWCSD
jgi:hypothetical protein